MTYRGGVRLGAAELRYIQRENSLRRGVWDDHRKCYVETVLQQLWHYEDSSEWRDVPTINEREIENEIHRREGSQAGR